jgi:hypothetical protein
MPTIPLNQPGQLKVRVAENMKITRRPIST